MILRSTVEFFDKQLSSRIQLASYTCSGIDDPEVMRAEVRFDVLAGAGVEYRIEISLSRDSKQYWISGGDITVSHTTSNILFLSSPIVVETDDAFKVFATRVDGTDELVAGDVDFYEDTGTSALQAIAADLTTAIADIATAITDIGNLQDVSAAQVNAECDTALSDYGANTTTPPTVGEIDTELTTQHGSGSWKRDIGSGSTVSTYTVYGPGPVALEGATVRVTSDVGGATILAEGTTDANGEVNFYLPVASGTTVYLWTSKSGYSFTNPDSEVTA